MEEFSLSRSCWFIWINAGFISIFVSLNASYAFSKNSESKSTLYMPGFFFRLLFSFRIILDFIVLNPQMSIANKFGFRLFKIFFQK